MQKSVMKIKYAKLFLFIILLLILFLLLRVCQYYLTRADLQYHDGKLNAPLTLKFPDLVKPVNLSDYLLQIEQIKLYSPSLYEQNKVTYEAIDHWIKQGLAVNELHKMGLQSYQMSGGDGYGNILLTGYFTPVIKARHIPDSQFKYPLYKNPTELKDNLPSREMIYQGALQGQELEIAYTASLIDNFLMDVQGSAYIDFEEGDPLVFFGYDGKNGFPYSSIGRLLVENGHIAKDKMSMQAIRDWAVKQDDETLKSFLSLNRSFVFFKPIYENNVKGSAGVPLIKNAAIASDKTVIPTGSVMLVDVPILDELGHFTKKREIRLVVALDVGGAIKDQHFDMYLGVGDDAGKLAGYYNHYGRAWLIKP